MNLHRLADDFEFNDFQLSDCRIRRYWIGVEADTMVHAYLKFPIYWTFRNLKDMECYEGSLSSFKRLLITESILEEL